MDYAESWPRFLIMREWLAHRDMLFGRLFGAELFALCDKSKCSSAPLYEMPFTNAKMLVII
jgi:hypothetical protein